MRVLVIGGSGFIGQRLVGRLLAEGHMVAILSRNPFFDSQGTGTEPQLIKGDIRIFPEVMKAIREQQSERIVHVAYTLTAEGEAYPYQALQVNALGSGNVFEAARLSGVKRVVFCSSIAAYAPPEFYPDRAVTEEEVLMKPTSIYGATKVLNEFLASRFEARYGVEMPALRISAVYGAGRADRGVTAWTSQMVESALSREPVTVKLRPDQWANFIYVDDVAEQLFRLTNKDHLDHRIYNSGGQTARAEDLAHVVRRTYIDLRVAFDPQAPAWPYPHRVDGSRLEREIGFVPRGIEEGLRVQMNEQRLRRGQGRSGN